MKLSILFSFVISGELTASSENFSLLFIGTSEFLREIYFIFWLMMRLRWNCYTNCRLSCSMSSNWHETDFDSSAPRITFLQEKLPWTSKPDYISPSPRQVLIWFQNTLTFTSGEIPIICKSLILWKALTLVSSFLAPFVVC